jgi:hypothetical protein
MRRRVARKVIDERPTILLMAAGAIAGAAAGMYLGRRYKTVGDLVEDVRHRLGDLRDLWYDDEADDIAGRLRGHARIGVDDGDDIDDIEDDEDVEDDYLEGSAADEDAIDDDSGEDDDEADYDDVYEFDDELAEVVRANGVVDEPTSAERAARQLEETVLATLHNEPLLNERPIEIAVVGDGVVELTGTVQAIEEGSRAAALVRRVPGVSMVLNRIEVRSGGHVDTASVPREPTDEADDRGSPTA